MAKKAANQVQKVIKSSRSWVGRSKKSIQSYLKRRPHRSFRRTYKRDIPSRAAMPGNIFFTTAVLDFMRSNWRSYTIFTLLYVVAYALFAGIASQENYEVLSESIRGLGPQIIGGEVSQSTQALLVFGATITGGVGAPQTELQRGYVALLTLLAWLSLIWFARHRYNGVSVKVRDALYNSGSPLVSTGLLVLLALVQLIPAALAVIMYTAAYGNGFLDIGVVAMLFGIGAILLIVLSLYWLSQTLLALILVTVPGTYPYQAIKMAGDIVIGRRLQLLLRLLWLAGVVVVYWALILVPVILIAQYVTISWLPLIPVTVQLLSASALLFSITYCYVLYRGMIDESIEPQH